jgi:hypothetical protein
MMTDNLKTIGDQLSAIASLAKSDAEPDDDDLLLYVEIEPGVVTPSLYADIDDSVLWKDMSPGMMELLFDLWYSTPTEKRWIAFSMAIRDGQFATTFHYSDSVIPGEEVEDRNRTVVKTHFGDKPIRYPPPDWE